MSTTFPLYQLGSNYFFKVPVIQSNGLVTKQIHNIVLCDTSGSMGSYWAKVANGWNFIVNSIDGTFSILLFDNTVKPISGKTLPLTQPYSGGTNIISALEGLKKEIYKYINYDLVRIYMITDGADTENYDFKNVFQNTIKTVPKPYNACEFYVMGLTESFPVFISQTIRANLHNGSSSIPNLFWSQECTQEEIVNEFANINKYNKSLCEITMEFLGYPDPYSEPTNKFYSNDWVLLKELPDKLHFTFENTAYSLELTPNPKFDVLIELFQQWVGLIQGLSIKTTGDYSPVVEKAVILKECMESMYNTYIKILPVATKSMTLGERIRNKEIKTKTLQYYSLLKIVKDIGSGVRLSFMSNIELAKQLKGIHLTKFSERNYKLRAHTEEDFEKDKAEFIKELEGIQETIKDLESSEYCVITLDNTLEIIRAPDFIETLTNCKDKVEFLQNFGITGHGVLLNLTDASSINPWVTQIKQVGVHCSTLSTTALEDMIGHDALNTELTKQEQDSCVVAIKVGDGDAEKLNAVIPLFNKKIAQVIAPIVQTNLFQLICTYSIQKSPMTINFNAHLGALSGLLGYLLTLSDSEWVQSTIEKIKWTTLIYSQRKFLSQFIDTIWNNPELALITEKPDSEIKCESITKALLMILISSDGKTPEQIQNTLFHVWKEYIGRVIGNNNNVSSWFELRGDEHFDLKVDFPDFNSVYSHGYSISEIKNSIVKSIKSHKLTRPDNVSVIVDKIKLTKQFNGGSVGNLTFKGLSVFTSSLGYTVQDEDLFRFITHTLIHTSSDARAEHTVLSYEESKDWIINELLGLKINELREAKIKEYQELATKRYFEIFESEHENIVIVMNKQQIISEAIDKGINVSEETFDSVYKINPNNMLLQNACMFKQCPYYLCPRKDFSSHMERIKADHNYIQSFHRTIFEFKDKPVNTIITNLSNGVARPTKYKNVPINSKITLEVEQEIELNKNAYQTIYN